MSSDSQQIISVDNDSKVYLWRASTGELTESAKNDPDSARLLWMARNEWKVGEEAATENSYEKLRVVVVGQDVYLYKQIRNGNSFEKIGQFDEFVANWNVDANGVLWVCFRGRNLARSTMVTESCILGSFEDEDII